MAEFSEAGIDAVAIAGEVKQFDVVADGTLIFSKQQQDRFPDAGEALRLLPA